MNQQKTQQRCVRDVMNPKVLYVLEGQRMSLVRAQILKFGVTGVPVLDFEHKPVGFISLRDLPTSSKLDGGESESDLEHLDELDELLQRGNHDVFSIQESETIEAAARLLAESDYERAVVVRPDGVAVGMVSAIDLLRAFTNVPPRHPPQFDK